MRLARIDRGPFVIPIWFGLLFTGIKTLVVAHSEQNLVYFHDPELPEVVEQSLAVVFIAACVACLIASAMATSWFSPTTPMEFVYKVEFVGLAFIILCITIDAFFNTIPLFQLFTLGGGFGGIIVIGSMAMMGRIWVALTHEPTTAAPAPEPDTN